MAEDIVDQAKEVLGVEDSPEQREHDLRKKHESGDATDRDRKELHELQEKGHDES